MSRACGWKRDALVKRIRQSNSETLSRLEEEEVNDVYVIINEWDDQNGSGSEIVENEFYPTVNSAWEALVIIAESHDSEIGPNDMTFVVRADDDAFESYYIQELNPA